ncbi:putative ATP-grasp-modified RiPP [Actinomadura chibensis]|uniref:putative ATP-grasp-modified RiPP n=1 Tax=Actinomadura chibensis TaxID=392828 RepID=UPI00157C0522|nr:putative ATP-grasp-modified RiPP [Actinomadura chibensis]
MDASTGGTARVPWGWTRVTDRLPISPPDWHRVELDPRTQIARYLDGDGQVIEAGKHGTKTTPPPTTTPIEPPARTGRWAGAGDHQLGGRHRRHGDRRAQSQRRPGRQDRPRRHRP